jgi:hypothetical protein
MSLRGPAANRTPRRERRLGPHPCPFDNPPLDVTARLDQFDMEDLTDLVTNRSNVDMGGNSAIVFRLFELSPRITKELSRRRLILSKVKKQRFAVSEEDSQVPLVSNHSRGSPRTPARRTTGSRSRHFTTVTMSVATATNNVAAAIQRIHRSRLPASRAETRSARFQDSCVLSSPRWISSLTAQNSRGRWRTER